MNKELKDKRYMHNALKKVIETNYKSEPEIELLERHEAIMTFFTFPLRRAYQRKLITFILRDKNTGDVFSKRMMLPMPCKTKIFIKKKK